LAKEQTSANSQVVGNQAIATSQYPQKGEVCSRIRGCRGGQYFTTVLASRTVRILLAEASPTWYSDSYLRFPIGIQMDVVNVD
jgi:hypothetical protein